ADSAPIDDLSTSSNCCCIFDRFLPFAAASADLSKTNQRAHSSRKSSVPLLSGKKEEIFRQNDEKEARNWDESSIFAKLKASCGKQLAALCGYRIICPATPCPALRAAARGNRESDGASGRRCR